MLALALRLHFRNPLALLYSYLFPTLFLLVFYVLYRYDQVPLVRHMGELLTVTVLGGACFGLPTALVSERERGVWRRYRLVPVPIRELVASTLVARYVLLLLAGLLQLALAMMLGMPVPQHPFDLWVAFTAVAFAFLGLGLVIAMLANTVPAVQALGQCLFLPLLVIGGIAVPLGSLPAWAQRVASFFPGRYAVDAIQAAVTGPGLGGVRFSVLALLVIGAAACVAGARLFRWDPRQRIATTAGVGWVGVALAAWLAVGLVNELRRAEPSRPAEVAMRSTAPPEPSPPPVPSSPSESERPEATVSTAAANEKPRPPEKRTVPSAPETRTEPREPAAPSVTTPAPTPPPTTTTTVPAPAVAAGKPGSWRAVTMEHVERDLRFDRLPPDNGVVTPIAPQDEEPDTDVANHLEFMATALISWPPAQVADPVQRVRNVLFVAAVPDVFQMEPLERFVPWVVYDHLRQNVPQDDLIKILYWIALHPMEGDDSAVDQLRALRLGTGPADIEQTRERVALYGVKLLGRLAGKLPR